MEADRLYHDPALAQFYDIENEWGEDSEFCRRLATGRSSILDLGCGTGLLAAALAQESGRLVVAVDPAGPMLELARQRPGGEHVQWVQGDARSVRLNQWFDLVVLTGHAFQVFLTAEDQAAVLRTIAKHLSPAGRFVFDTRNPLVEEWREWTPEKSERLIEHPMLGQVLAWNDVAHDSATGVVTYGTYYKTLAESRLYSARSRIAFPTREQLASMIEDAGLVVETWLGDWSGSIPCAPTAPEIIPIGTLQ